jgi:hypothetical protein
MKAMLPCRTPSQTTRLLADSLFLSFTPKNSRLHSPRRTL